MGRSPTLLITVVLLATAVGVVSSLNARADDLARRELAVAFTLRVVGGLVSVVGLVGVLGQWYAGAGAARLAAGGVVVLAGAAVAGQSWAATLGLAGVLVAALLAAHRPGADR